MVSSKITGDLKSSIRRTRDDIQTWVAKAVNAEVYTYRVFDDVLLVAVMKDGHICELCERNTRRRYV